jgi:hypothetical protein
MMVPTTMENFTIEICRDMVSINGRMDGSTLGNGLMVRCKAKVYLPGLMVKGIVANSLTIIEKVTESITSI